MGLGSFFFFGAKQVGHRKIMHAFSMHVFRTATVVGV